MKHSKGEWRVKRTMGAPEIVTDKRRIATAWYHGGSEDAEVDYNALLISAAPELLAICEEIANGGMDVRLADSEQRIRLYHAIAKAHGGTLP